MGLRSALWLKRLIGDVDPQGARIHGSPFYKVYPFSSPVPIKSADFRGAVDIGLHVFYNRIAKAANSSVVFTLAKLRSGETSYSNRIKKDFTRPSQLTHSQVRALDGYFKFTFVRDPYDRVLSAYLGKIARGAEITPDLARISAKPTFHEFCRYLADTGLYQNAHWAPQTALMLLPLIAFDFIGKVENFDRDISTVLSRLGAEDPAGFAAIHLLHATQARLRANDYYDDKTRDLIGDLYQADFDAFGYKK